jgi:uncharacterized protein YigE (DUF2233 family)
MHLRLLILLLLAALPSCASASPKSNYAWTPLSDGLQYASYPFALSETEQATIHAFRIDPARYRISIVTARDEETGVTVAEMAKQSRAFLVINGGFFTPEHRSIGLLIKDGKRVNPLHETSWWSIFAIKGGRPFIAPPRDFQEAPDVSMAVQAGPRLVVDGSIPKLKEGLSTRSAIGITQDSKVVIAVTSGAGISLKELARRMKGSRHDGGLECPNAMGLDGGSSSQLYAKVGDFELSLEGLARVTNGVGVFTK